MPARSSFNGPVHFYDPFLIVLDVLLYLLVVVRTSGLYSINGPLDVISLCGPGDNKLWEVFWGFSKYL